MNEGNLFCCSYEITERGCFSARCLWKALDEEGCMGFGSMSFGLAVQKFLNIE
jgi:hypothetical protein